MANLFSLSSAIRGYTPMDAQGNIVAVSAANLQTGIANVINAEAINSLFVPTIDKHITDLTKIADATNASESSMIKQRLAFFKQAKIDAPTTFTTIFDKVRKELGRPIKDDGTARTDVERRADADARYPQSYILKVVRDQLASSVGDMFAIANESYPVDLSTLTAEAEKVAQDINKLAGYDRINRLIAAANSSSGSSLATIKST